MSEEVLSAPHVMEFPYTRSTGPVVGAFLTGLRDQKVLAYKASDGRVVCPPPEFDAGTNAPVAAAGLVEVGPEGVVTSWSWNPVPRDGNPFDRPFAWALVRLDGADSSMLHALDADRAGFIHDIACFEPA